MSWADDGGIGWGWCEEDEDDIQERREEDWKNGIHFDKDFKEWKIRDMTDFHLLNTIKYFKYYNTKPLLKEAKKRKLI